MKRKNATIPREVFEFSKDLSPDNQGLFWRLILGFLFKNEDINYTGLENDLIASLAGSQIILRANQIRFKNGCQKKTNYTKPAYSALLKEAKRSEIKQKEASENTGFYNNNINNINNINNQSINQSIKPSSDEQRYFGELKEIFKKINNVTVRQRALAILLRLTSESEFKILDSKRNRAEVLSQIFNNLKPLSPLELENTLEELFAEIDSHRVNNKLNYEIASLFNLRTTTQKKISFDFLNRDLSPEDFQKVIDDIDEVEL